MLKAWRRLYTVQVCKEEETQEHILKFKMLNSEEKEIVDYSKIKNGNIIEMLNIAKKFKKNLEIREQCVKQ